MIAFSDTLQLVFESCLVLRHSRGTHIGRHRQTAFSLVVLTFAWDETRSKVAQVFAGNTLVFLTIEILIRQLL